MSALCSGLSHVGLAVSDIEASFKFFEVLGYKKIGYNPDYPAYFMSDENSIVTLWQTSTESVPFDRKKHVGLHHLALKVPSEEALDTVYETVLKIPGVKSDFAPEPFGFGKHAMVFDPSGIRVEFSFHK